MGLIFLVSCLISVFIWVAIEQAPFFHLAEGSRNFAQYFPVGYSTILWHPSHCSTMVLQVPPLNWHPFLVMNIQSNPTLIVEQTILTTSFLLNFNNRPCFLSGQEISNRDICLKIYPLSIKNLKF
jgi:hypothetical protein